MKTNVLSKPRWEINVTPHWKCSPDKKVERTVHLYILREAYAFISKQCTLWTYGDISLIIMGSPPRAGSTVFWLVKVASGNRTCRCYRENAQSVFIVWQTSKWLLTPKFPLIELSAVFSSEAPEIHGSTHTHTSRRSPHKWSGKSYQNITRNSEQSNA